MGFIKRLVDLVNIEIEEPAAFGGFHFSCIILVLVACYLLYLLSRDISDRGFRRIIGVCFCIMLTLELFKQLSMSFQLVDGKLVFEYLWDAFPFQLCSTPLYVLPLLSLLPDCRLRDVLASYTMTFGLIGGVAVYLVPKTVFTFRAAINVQTMVHHGIQIVTGVFTALYYKKRITHRFFFGGVALFGVFFAIANVLNTVGYDFFVRMGWMADGAAFNMFYISPRADQTIPMFEDLVRSVHPAIAIIGYGILLVIGAYVLYSLARIFSNFEDKIEERRVHRGGEKEA